MALREFGDREGSTWQVWESRPTPAHPDSAEARYFSRYRSDPSGEVPGRFTSGREAGWLTFTCGDQRRRLSPIPSGWEKADERALREYLARSDAVLPKRVAD